MNAQDLWGFRQSDRMRRVSAGVCGIASPKAASRRAGSPTLPWGLLLDQLPFRQETGVYGCGVRPWDSSGRIEPRKGQLELVRAFARVIKVHPSARLTLAGPVASEAYAARVRAAIAALGLRRSVTLTGAVRNVSALLRQWDLFVSMSGDEGQGMAVLEAMAVGVPVAARAASRASRTSSSTAAPRFSIEGASTASAAETILDALSSPDRRRTVACATPAVSSSDATPGRAPSPDSIGFTGNRSRRNLSLLRDGRGKVATAGRGGTV